MTTAPVKDEDGTVAPPDKHAVAALGALREALPRSLQNKTEHLTHVYDLWQWLCNVYAPSNAAQVRAMALKAYNAWTYSEEGLDDLEENSAALFELYLKLRDTGYTKLDESDAVHKFFSELTSESQVVFRSRLGILGQLPLDFEELDKLIKDHRVIFPHRRSKSSRTTALAAGTSQQHPTSSSQHQSKAVTLPHGFKPEWLEKKCIACKSSSHYTQECRKLREWAELGCPFPPDYSPPDRKPSSGYKKGNQRHQKKPVQGNVVSASPACVQLDSDSQLLDSGAMQHIQKSSQFFTSQQPCNFLVQFGGGNFIKQSGGGQCAFQWSPLQEQESTT